MDIGINGRKHLMVRGLCREHTLLRQGRNNNTNDPVLQLARWNILLGSWKATAAGNLNCVIIGDINLDFLN